jgi:hypothetical protein
VSTATQPHRRLAQTKSPLVPVVLAVTAGLELQCTLCCSWVVWSLLGHISTCSRTRNKVSDSIWCRWDRARRARGDGTEERSKGGELGSGGGRVPQERRWQRQQNPEDAIVMTRPSSRSLTAVVRRFEHNETTYSADRHPSRRIAPYRISHQIKFSVISQSEEQSLIYHSQRSARSFAPSSSFVGVHSHPERRRLKWDRHPIYLVLGKRSRTFSCDCSRRLEHPMKCRNDSISNGFFSFFLLFSITIHSLGPVSVEHMSCHMSSHPSS